MKWEKQTRPEGCNCGSFVEITSLKEDTQREMKQHLSQNLYEIRFSISLPGQCDDRPLFSLFRSLSLSLSLIVPSQIAEKIEMLLRRDEP